MRVFPCLFKIAAEQQIREPPPSPYHPLIGGARRFLTYGNKSYNWNIYDVVMELDSGLMVSLGGRLQLGQGNSQP